MRLLSPIGVLVEVSDETGARLIRDEGFREPQVEEPAAPPSPVKRARRKTTDN